ncbi:MAG TPA: hypothetical protein VNG73_06345, partial [Gemmatimonadaceae bacterium]|nr:hypothetical protein [Gemmatimonadaceae bacterium]
MDVTFVYAGVCAIVIELRPRVNDISNELIVGGDDGNGYKVATVLGESVVAAVYTTADNHL